MSPFRVPFALLAFFGFVMVVPAWMHFIGARTGSLPIEVQFFAQLSLPAFLMLFVASWAQPRGA